MPHPISMNNALVILLVASLVAAFGCEEKPAADAPAETSATAEEAPAEEGSAEEAPAEEAEEPAAPAESGATGQKTQEMPGDMNDGDAEQFGAEFAIAEDPITLASALENADANAGKAIKVSAKLDKVCKKKGCWFTLASDGVEEPVRVRMKDYGFFVPRNADGAAAVVEGTLEKKVIPQAEAQHYADESGAEKKKVDGDQTEYHFTATAVHLTKSAS